MSNPRPRGDTPENREWRESAKKVLRRFLDEHDLTRKQFANEIGLTFYQVKAILEGSGILQDGWLPYALIYYHTGLEVFDPVNLPRRKVNNKLEHMAITQREYHDFCRGLPNPAFLEVHSETKEEVRVPGAVMQLVSTSRVSMQRLIDTFHLLSEEMTPQDRDEFQSLLQTELGALYQLLLPYTKGPVDRERLMHMNRVMGG